MFPTLITLNDSELFKIKLSEPKILISPPNINQQGSSASSVHELDSNFEEENEFNQLFMLQDDEDFEEKIDNQESLEPLCLSDNINGGFNNNSGNLQNNNDSENKANPQTLISKKTINFIKKYLAEKEDKDNYEEYKYKTNDEVNAIEEFEKTIVI